ncbi:MAG: DUF4065 domain-containing protein [archaeon]|nr:DUF4065 domain-containing protein [archaeon]
MSTEVIQAADVADFFIDLCKDSKHPMTNLRLNKMLYFAQGWHLATYGTPLFSDPIQAWDKGPVIPTIYHANKKYHSKAIPVLQNPGYLRKFDGSNINTFLVDVYNQYEFRSTQSLVSETHAEDSPWKMVFDGTLNKEIPQELIQKHFSELPPLKRFDVRELKHLPIVDADGKLIRAAVINGH